MTVLTGESDPMVMPELLGHKVLPERPDQPVVQDEMERMEPVGHMELPELLVHMAQWANQDLMELQEKSV